MELEFSDEALATIRELKADRAREGLLKQVEKTVRFMSQGTFTPGMHRKVYQGRTCPHGGTLFQVYVQNRTPGAWRLWFCECDSRLVIELGPHP